MRPFVFVKEKNEDSVDRKSTITRNENKCIINVLAKNWIRCLVKLSAPSDLRYNFDRNGGFYMGNQYPARTYNLVDYTITRLYQEIEAEFEDYTIQKRESFGLLTSYLRLFLSGKKKTTIRYRKYAIDCPANKEMNLFETQLEKKGSERYVGRVQINKMIIKPFGQLNDEDAINDGFSSVEELRLALEMIYGIIGDPEPVTIYWVES